MDLLTYVPALIVLLAVVVPCIWLFRKWLKEDAEKKIGTNELTREHNVRPAPACRTAAALQLWSAMILSPVLLILCRKICF
jgi:hypothetical protein